jgi:endonuclease YncB( thermonuclease family)
MENLNWNQYNILLNSTNEIKPFSFNGKILLAKVIHIIDGDTIKVNIFIGKELKQFVIRMYGYDSPEMKTKNPIEKQYAIRSKNIISQLIFNKIVKLECFKYDKYGRILANVFIKLNQKIMNVNQFMIDNRLGYSYFGTTKITFEELYNKNYYKSYQKINIPKTFNYYEKSIFQKLFCCFQCCD